MGFSVDPFKRLVTVDHSHNHFCITTPSGNPAVLYLNGLKVTSIFSRTKGKRDKNQAGDNSPMLYVMKGIGNLTTHRRDIGMLCASFRQILPVYLEDEFSWDWIVPLPSSSPVCTRFASKVFKLSGERGCLQQNALTKITGDAAMKNVASLSITAKEKSVLSSDIRNFIKQHSATAPFQMKYAKTHLRHHINPLMWNSIPLGTPPPCRVLLIDDMVTSGTSLLCAESIIKARYPSVSIEALTLFGSSK